MKDSKKQQNIEVDGIITKILPDATFKVKLLNTEHEIDAKISGKMRMNYIKIMSGDRVKVSLTPYDLNRGRIIYRYK